MTTRIVTAFFATAVIASCSNGQKDRAILSTEIDSVSYAIGADIGGNFKRNKLENVNVLALSNGMRDALDSNSLMSEELVQQVVQAYMMKLQAEKMKAEQAQGEENRIAGEKFLAENGKRKEVTTTSSGLQYEVIKMGTGAKPKLEEQVKVHYHGTLINGTMFDSSVERGKPIEYPVNGFVQGWQEALQLMPVGSKWKIYVPSELGYGSQAAPGGKIPANSTLVFELELLEILK